MKHIVIALILIIMILFIGCNNKSDNVNYPSDSVSGINSLINELERLGYYKYISEEKAKEVKKESINAGYAFGWEDSGRDFSEDAENIAEGGVDDLFESVKAFLNNQNVEVLISEEAFTDKSYEININGKTYEMYSEEELNSEDFWELSTVRSFSIINKLLKEAGSKERVYILYGGNDLRAVFLTDDMYQLISKSNLLPESEKPKAVPDET